MDHVTRGSAPAPGRAAPPRRRAVGARARDLGGRARDLVPLLACPVAVALILLTTAAAAPAAPVRTPYRAGPARLRQAGQARAVPRRESRGAAGHRGAAARRTASALRPAVGQGPAVGVLLRGSMTGGHFCTGTVVDSPVRDLMVTAAHCVLPGGHLRSFSFVPGYRDGRAPYGVWRPRQVVVSPRWVKSADPADDVAFVIMRPSHGKELGQAVAGQRIGRSATVGAKMIHLAGYPDSAQRPVVCASTVTRGVHGLEIHCPGFTAGTSGGPWIAGPPAGTGWVVGVIGGYEEGGVSPSVSYSPVFGAGVAAVYREAVRRARQLAPAS